MQEDRQYTKQLKSKAVGGLHILQNRFLVVGYVFDGNSKECDIFDLQENRQYTIQLKNKAIEGWDILANRFCVVRYRFDGNSKECDIFDLQETENMSND